MCQILFVNLCLGVVYLFGGLLLCSSLLDGELDFEGFLGKDFHSNIGGGLCVLVED